MTAASLLREIAAWALLLPLTVAVAAGIAEIATALLLNETVLAAIGVTP